MNRPKLEEEKRKKRGIFCFEMQSPKRTTDAAGVAHATTAISHSSPPKEIVGAKAKTEEETVTRVLISKRQPIVSYHICCFTFKANNLCHCHIHGMSIS